MLTRFVIFVFVWRSLRRGCSGRRHLDLFPALENDVELVDVGVGLADLDDFPVQVAVVEEFVDFEKLSAEALVITRSQIELLFDRRRRLGQLFLLVLLLLLFHFAEDAHVNGQYRLILLSLRAFLALL